MASFEEHPEEEAAAARWLRVALVRREEVATAAIAEVTRLRQVKNRFMLIFVGLQMIADESGEASLVDNPSGGRSEDESDAGHNEQRVHDKFKLPIGKALEDAQSEPSTEQCGRYERERLPVQIRLSRYCGPHQVNRDQRQGLHTEDERLVHAALVRLVPAFESAPDGNERTGKPGKAACYPTQKPGAYVREGSRRVDASGPAQHEIEAIDDEHTSDDHPIGCCRKMEQEIDPGGHPEQAANQENAETAPVDCAPERGNAEHLNGDAADNHHLHRVNRALDDVKEQGSRQCRKGKSSNAGDGGRSEDRD